MLIRMVSAFVLGLMPNGVDLKAIALERDPPIPRSVP